MQINVQIIKETDLPTDHWSGGSATPLVRWPENSSYEDQDFLWWISTSTVENIESDFSDLTGYFRAIFIREGEITLQHGSKSKVDLPTGSTYWFDGSWNTHAWGKATDFNLMLRKGQANGGIWSCQLEPGMGLTLSPCGNFFLQHGERLLFCSKGTVEVTWSNGKSKLTAGELLRASNNNMILPGLNLLTGKSGATILDIQVWSEETL